MTRVLVPWMGVVALGLVACAQGTAPARVAVDDVTPLGVDSTLVYFREAEQQAVLVDVTRTPVRVQREPMPVGRCRGKARPGSEGAELVVLCGGRDASTTDDAVGSTLLVLGKAGVVREYALPGRLTSFELSEDGEHAFVFGAEGRLVLATEGAFVALSLPPSADNPRAVTVRSLAGEIPTGAVFSPAMQIAGEERHLAVVLSGGHVHLFDLGHLDRGEITAPLSAESSVSLLPQQIEFGDGRLYVRASGLGHVLSLVFSERAAEPGGHDFHVSSFQLATGSGVQSMLVLPRETGELLLALSGNNVFVFDPRTGVSTRVPTGVAYTDVVRFRGGAPGDPNPRDRALLFGGGSEIGFLDLDGVETRLARNLETLRLPAAVIGAFSLVELGRVAFLHEPTNRLSVVELDDRTVVPVRANRPLGDAVADEPRGRLWLRADNTVLTLSLSDFSGDEVLLDAPVTGLVLLPGESARVVALHADDSGHVTVLGLDAPSRASARSVSGFLWEGLFDEGSAL